MNIEFQSPRRDLDAPNDKESDEYLARMERLFGREFFTRDGKDNV